MSVKIKDFFHRRFSSIYKIQTSEIPEACKKIYPLIKFELSSHDQKFQEAFSVWRSTDDDKFPDSGKSSGKSKFPDNGKLPDKSRLPNILLERVQMKNVDAEVDNMEREYETLRDNIDEYMINANNLKKNIENASAEVISLCDKLLKEPSKGNEEEREKIVNELVGNLDKICEDESCIANQQLKLVELHLNLYNEARKRWADFLIGMRALPNKDRNQVPKNKK